MTEAQREVAPDWVPYLDLDMDVKPYLQIPEESTDSDTQLQLFLDMGCEWVQRYLGQPVAPTEFFRFFTKWGGSDRVVLPYAPVLGDLKVIEWWASSGPHELTEQTPAKQGNQEMFQVDRLKGIVFRTFMGLLPRPYFPGLRNIEITWTAGYNPIPADIKIATLEFIAHWWRNTQQASRGASSPTPRMEEYGGADVVVSGMWAGVPNRIISLLSPYEQVGIG
ncbi:MAG TPA: hypothetical protein VGF95_14515 [Solirubrobacteraceae bacterium]|jgi:hypothetical protein